MLILSKVEVLLIMNNRGFTLVELLAVLAILASMSLVVVMGISASLDRRDEKECENQKQLAINAAKIYFYENDWPIVCVKSGLINGGYIDEGSLDKLNLTGDCSSYVQIETDEDGNDTYAYHSGGDGGCK